MPTLTYNANGDTLTDGNRTYGWDARHRLVSLSGAASANFRYDAFGRRTQKTVNGTSTNYLYDGANPVQELDGTTPTANLLTGMTIDEFFRRTDSTGTRDFITDALGSVLALTDSAGVTQTSYTYDPYGNTTQTGQQSSNPFQYTGRENDGTGLYFYRARYYSPGMQRFVSPDPLGQMAGVNEYTYVRNNPLRYIDPLGLLEFSGGGEASAHVAVVGGGVGTGFSIDNNGTICVYGSISLTFGLGMYTGAGANMGGSSGTSSTGLSGTGGLFLEGGGGIVAGTEVNVGSDGSVGGGKGFGGIGAGGAAGYRQTGKATYCFNEPKGEECKK